MTKIITDSEIARLEELEQAATPGPWEHDLDCYEAGVIEAGVFDPEIKMLFTADTGERYKDADDNESWVKARTSREANDAAFIAEIRTQTPRLLDTLRRYKEALDLAVRLADEVRMECVPLVRFDEQMTRIRELVIDE